MNKVRIIPAIVRAFFSSFVEGLVVGSANGNAEEQREVSPREMKQLLLDHYEEVSKYLFHVCFHPIALISYDDEAELEQRIKSVAPASLTPQVLLEYACGSKEMTELMIDEYRRNFYAILSGRIMTVNEFFEGFDAASMPARSGAIGEQRAIHSLLMTIKDGFKAGMKAAGSEDRPINMIYLYRLVEDNMQCLMHDKPVLSDDDEDLNHVFLKVCGSLENMNFMLEELSK